MEFEKHWRREYSLFQAVAYCRAISTFISELTGRTVLVRFEGEGGWTTGTTEKGSIAEIWRLIGKMLHTSPETVNEHFGVLQHTGEALVEISRPPQNLRDLALEKLVELHTRIHAALEAHGIILFTTFYDVEIVGKEFERAVLAHAAPSEVSKIVAYASRPEEKAHVLTIADHFGREEDLQKRVAFLRENFPWILATDPYIPPPSDEELTRYAESFSEASPEESDAAPALPPEVAELLPLYRKIIHLKDKRDEYRRQGAYVMHPLVEELMRRLSVTRDELWYTLPWELDRFLHEPEKMRADVAKRKTAYLYEAAHGGERLLQGRPAADLFVRDAPADTGTLTGTVGSTGKIRGKVRIVRSASEVKNFPAGYVLVATTTNPDYVPAMQRAVAFVTDEGGITCHAAIVAREMKKPAVVGVKSATKILHDGDEVEVDAEQGIVRVLNKNS
jgi:phosphoenolpyruvate synthase/pyruvate phosphate dikinase